MWTQLGIEHVTKLKKLEEYGQPKVNKPVSSKVQKIFYTSNFMETALEGKLIKKVGSLRGSKGKGIQVQIRISIVARIAVRI